MITNITLPWPPKELSPNARKHFMAHYKAKRAYREACYWQAVEQGARKLDAERLHVHFEFHKPSRRRMDIDGALSRMKSGIDGLADVLCVDDSRWTMSMAFAEEIGGFVRVTIKEAR